MNPEYTRQERFPRYAAILKERFAQGMLAELAPYPNFVVWRYRVIDGQKKKPPFNPNTHQPASPTESSTWGSLEKALHALATGNFQGIGFMLSHSPFAGLDLDHCLQDGTVEPWAQEIITALNTYTEYSPSWNRKTGTGGVHLLLAGKPLTNKKVGTIELYGQKRYLTLTTNHFEGTPTTIEQRQEAIDALYRRFAPPVVQGESQNTRLGGGSSASLTELPPGAANDSVLQQLLRGDMSRFGNDHSRADFVLVLKLLHWTGDNVALTRKLFVESGLYREDKTERKTGATTYLDMTIHNALKKRRNPPMKR
jgi:putative DNA primase/helicase